MTRKSFQRITLSVELTLPPGIKPKEVTPLLEQALEDTKLFRREQAIIKIIKRETIYP